MLDKYKLKNNIIIRPYIAYIDMIHEQYEL